MTPTKQAERKTTIVIISMRGISRHENDTPLAHIINIYGCVYFIYMSQANKNKLLIYKLYRKQAIQQSE